METVLNLLLIRFAVIAAVVVAIALVLFAIAVRLRRRGRLQQTRDRVVRGATPWIRHLTDNAPGRSRSFTGQAGSAAIKYMAQKATEVTEQDQHRSHDDRPER